MGALSIVLAVAALITGLTAAWYWYQSSTVSIDPGWTPPGFAGPSEPLIPEGQQMGWTVATLAAFNQVAGLNKLAALWTAASVVLSALASVISAAI